MLGNIKYCKLPCTGTMAYGHITLEDMSSYFFLRQFTLKKAGVPLARKGLQRVENKSVSGKDTEKDEEQA